MHNRTRQILTWLSLIIGALAMVATGVDHLEEYAVNQFSAVPTIGTLFLLNFIAATVVAVGLVLPLGWLGERLARSLRTMLAIAGIGIAASSLIALWISETSSLFGFTDHGFRAAIVTASAAEGTAIISLSAYLALSGIQALRPHSSTHPEPST